MKELYLEKNVNIDKSVCLKVAMSLNRKVSEDFQDYIDSIFGYKQRLFSPQTVYELINISIEKRRVEKL